MSRSHERRLRAEASSGHESESSYHANCHSPVKKRVHKYVVCGIYIEDDVHYIL
jgi:hypothetical protein